MTKKTKVEPADLALFQENLKGVKRFVEKKVRLSPKNNKVIQEKIAISDRHQFQAYSELEDVGTEGALSYKQSSISNKTLRKLRKGQYNIEATLDLHGMRVEVAESAVDVFLQECSLSRRRVVLIIHGKGHHSSRLPTLKNKLNHWLRELNMVLAFCSAAPQHGSRGAIYVLLKHSIEEDNPIE